MVVKPMIGLPKPLIKHYFLLFLLGILGLLPYCRCFANTSLRELLKLDIEQLVNERIVSLNKRPQQTFDLAASVYVFTRYDIQRSGALTVPDLLMRVPGVYVRQPTKQDATISIRNDNQFFNANMLLLIDGKALYSPVTNNFQWRLLPISVEDI
jgi:iron complex outermembrane receptor protein